VRRPGPENLDAGTGGGRRGRDFGGARVGAQLGNLVAAFGANDADVIRREAEGVVQVVMGQRKSLQREQMQILSEKVHKLKAELHEARESAALDPLTQLHNRSSLDSQLERVADLSFRSAPTPCLLMIDVDHFKSVNDRFGHPIGDEVIRRVADTLARNFLRREDFVGRSGARGPSPRHNLGLQPNVPNDSSRTVGHGHGHVYGHARAISI
jgi:hypothetical protein